MSSSLNDVDTECENEWDKSNSSRSTSVSRTDSLDYWDYSIELEFLKDSQGVTNKLNTNLITKENIVEN